MRRELVGAGAPGLGAQRRARARGRCRSGGPRPRRGSRRAARRVSSGSAPASRPSRSATATFDHREHEQPIEQARRARACGCARAARRRSRRRSRTPRAARGAPSACATWMTWRVSSCARRAIASTRSRALGVAADQRQRRLRGLALAVQVIGVHGIEIGERDLEPPRIGRAPAAAHRRAAGTHADDVTIDVREEGDEAVHRGVSRGPASAPRRCARRSSPRTRAPIDGTLVPYNELLARGERDQRARRPDVGGPPRRGDPRCRARVRAGGLAVLLGPRARSRDVRRARRGRRQRPPTPQTQRFVEHTLRDYRRAGVDKPPEVRERLKQIDEELTRLGQQFSKNIAEDVRADRDHAIRRGSPACRPTSSPRTRPTRAARSGSPPTTPTTTRS